MTDELIGPSSTFADIGWLRGLKVLEVTTGVAAPLVGRVLRELGAEVTKIESHAKLDVNRMRVPRPSDPEGYPASEAFQLLHEANVGKKSVTLNLKEPAGKAVFIDLLKDSDVFIENFAPGWLERLGLSIPAILELSPRLVMLSASGYGQTGPLRTQRAYAPVMTSLAGVEGLIGYEGGEVMGCSALALADLNCSFHGVFLVLAALRGRRGTGTGQHIDLSQTEASASLIGEAFLEQQLNNAIPHARGNVGPDGEVWRLIAAAGDDAWVAAGTDQSRDGEAELQRPDGARPSTAELLERLAAHGLESSPVLSPDQVAADELFAQRGLLQHVQHPFEMIGQLTVTSIPWHLDGAVPIATTPAPCIGADNDSFYGERMTADQYAEYSALGVFH